MKFSDIIQWSLVNTIDIHIFIAILQRKNKNSWNIIFIFSFVCLIKKIHSMHTDTEYQNKLVSKWCTERNCIENTVPKVSSHNITAYSMNEILSISIKLIFSIT